MHASPRLVAAAAREPAAVLAETGRHTVLGASVLLPFSPLGRVLGFVPLPGGWWPVLGLTVAAYVVVVHAVKTRLVRRGWID